MTDDFFFYVGKTEVLKDYYTLQILISRSFYIVSTILGTNR